MSTDHDYISMGQREQPSSSVSHTEKRRRPGPQSSYQPPSNASGVTPVVETVHDDDEYGLSAGASRPQPQHYKETFADPTTADLPSTAAAKYVISCMPQTQEQAIQFVMTLLFTLFVAGALLSFLAAQQYRLIVAIVWLLLSCWLGLLCYLVLEAIQDDTTHNTERRRRGRVAQLFHPMVQTAADLVATEIQNFRNDWSEQVLLLTYQEEGDAVEEEEDDAGDNKNNTEQPTNNNKQRWRRRSSQRDNAGGGRKQPKSRLFRILVRPILPLIQRRKQQQQKQQQPAPMNDAELV